MPLAPGALALLSTLARLLGTIGAAIASLIAGGDADAERAKLAKHGVIIDSVASDEAKAKAESHYP